jgi:hypothetical protein
VLHVDRLGAVGLVRGLVLALGAALAAGLALQASAATQQAPSRMLDRTYRCAVGVSGGIRSVEVQAQTGIRDLEDRSKWRALANFLLIPHTGTSSIAAGAGGPVAHPAPPLTGFWALGCQRVRAGVPLSPGRLGGGRASQFTDRYQCPAPRVVLVRVRVEFARPVSVGTRTSARVRTASMAVRTTAGKPIAYADVHESGQARLFTATICVAE